MSGAKSGVRACVITRLENTIQLVHAQFQNVMTARATVARIARGPTAFVLKLADGQSNRFANPSRFRLAAMARAHASRIRTILFKWNSSFVVWNP